MLNGKWLWLVITITSLSRVRAFASGLYKSTDNVTILDDGNIQSTLNHSATLWLVEYYLDWCGHCQKFAPVYKSFAKDVADWFPIVKLGVVNCAGKENVELCRKLNVDGVPDIRFYSVGANLFDVNVPKIKDNPDAMPLKDNLLRLVEKNLDQVVWLSKRPKPTFLPADLAYISHFVSVRKKTDKKARYLALVFEDASSQMGKEIILDMSSCSNIVVRRVVGNMKNGRAIQRKYAVESLPQVVVVSNNGSFHPLHVTAKTRHSYIEALKKLEGVDEDIEDLPVLDTAEEDVRNNNNAIDYKNVKKDRVYLADLESALRYMLTVEVAAGKVITGERLDALKKTLQFFSDIGKHFPGREATVTFIKHLNMWTQSKHLIMPADWLQVVNEKKVDRFLPSTNTRWVGCLPSVPNLRGYPCSLWTLFHVLTVAATQAKLDRRRFPDVMYSYITNFFGCLECRKNFKKEVKQFPYQYTENNNDVILWLWKMHNKVNKRLHAEKKSEDPYFPKVQFPSPSMCPQCREGSSGAWNENEVSLYLTKHYAPDTVSWEYLDTAIKESESNFNARLDEAEDFHWNHPRGRGSHYRRYHGNDPKLTKTDMHLCIVLWLISSSLVIMLCYTVSKKNLFRRIKLTKHSV